MHPSEMGAAFCSFRTHARQGLLPDACPGLAGPNLGNF